MRAKALGRKRSRNLCTRRGRFPGWDPNAGTMSVTGTDEEPAITPGVCFQSVLGKREGRAPGAVTPNVSRTKHTSKKKNCYLIQRQTTHFLNKQKKWRIFLTESLPEGTCQKLDVTVIGKMPLQPRRDTTSRPSERLSSIRPWQVQVGLWSPRNSALPVAMPVARPRGTVAQQTVTKLDTRQRGTQHFLSRARKKGK